MSTALLWAAAVLTAAVAGAPPVLGAAAEPPPHGRSLERIVGVVDKDVITEGELQAEARLALVQREGARAAFVPLPQAYLASFIDHLISQVLVAQEARRMGAAGASEQEVNARLAALAAQFDGQEAYLTFLNSLTMDVEFVRQVMARDVQNDRFVRERLRTRLLAQGRGDGRHAPGAAPGPHTASPNATSRAEHKALERWLGELRRAAQVRVLDNRGLLHLERR